MYAYMYKYVYIKDTYIMLLDDVEEWCNEEKYILKRKAQDSDA